MYLKARRFFDLFLRNWRHADFCDRGGWGVRHYERGVGW